MPREINGKLPTESQLAYAIRHKIDNEGYTGGQYMQQTLDEINGKYTKLLQEALTKCVDSYVIKQFNILPTS